MNRTRYFDVTLDSDLPADTPELAIPEDLQDPEDSSRVNAALAYDGPSEELEVIIAPPAWSGRWGLDRPLEIGERFQAVGYINRTDDGLFRPVVFWYGDDDVPVNQVLGSTLPVRAPLPDAATSTAPSDDASAPAPSTTSTALDPLDVPAADPESTAQATTAPGLGSSGRSSGSSSSQRVVGGFVYLRRRARQS